MPTYEYRCENCGVVEADQRISDPPLEACPVCGCLDVVRLVSGVAVVFRGGGWARDGYSRPPPKSPAGSGTGGTGGKS